MGTEMNEARMRMARVPNGAELVHNKVSAAPGFWIGNVITMAGVPAIMQAMLDEVAPKLKTGAQMLSESIRADLREGDIGTELGEVAKPHPDVTIGSYPFFDDNKGPNTNIVIRARDAAQSGGGARGGGRHAAPGQGETHRMRANFRRARPNRGEGGRVSMMRQKQNLGRTAWSQGEWSRAFCSRACWR